MDFKEVTSRAGFTWGEYMESGIRYWAYKTIQNAIEQTGTLDRAKIMDTLWSMNLNIMGEEMVHSSKGYGTLSAYPCQVQGGGFVSMWPLEKALSLHNYKNP